MKIGDLVHVSARSWYTSMSGDVRTLTGVLIEHCQHEPGWLVLINGNFETFVARSWHCRRVD